ncbi:MAG: hypothetical protein COB02_16635 [Candidatus Cloacimonadota bacterium]|nr:MAG: hypothetical protein COB02_16635 [Candidatus Cloacimonadota bacterium]
MRGLYRLSIFFTLGLIALGWFLYPRTKELIYVFERNRNYVQLERLYTRKLKEKPNSLIEKKLLLVKVELRREGADQYAMGYLQKSFSGNFFNALLTKFTTKHVYASEGQLLEIGYNFTKETKYLILQKKLYSFLGWGKKLIKVLRQLYVDTQELNILNDLFGLNDKTYVIEQLFIRVETLNLTGLTLLRNFLSWTNQVERAYYMTKKYITVEKLDKNNKDLHLSRAIYFSDDLQVIKIYDLKFKETNDLKYLNQRAYYQEYYGYVKESLDSYVQYYKVKPDLEVLDRIVKNSRYTNNMVLYRKYRFDLALLTNDYDLFSEEIDDLIQKKLYKSAIKKCDLFINKQLRSIQKSPSNNKLYYLNLSYQVLYVVLHESGQTKILIDLINSKNKVQLTNTELAYLCDFQTINQKNIDTFILYYNRAKYSHVQDTVMAYSIQSNSLEKNFQIYTQLNGPFVWTQVEDYLNYYKNFPKKYEKELVRLVDTQKEARILVNVALKLQENKNNQLAQVAFQKALIASPFAKEALLQLGLLFYNSGDLTRGKYYFERYYSIDQTHLLVNFNLADTLEDGSALKTHLYKSVIKLANMKIYEDKVLVLRATARLKLTKEAYILYVDMINQYGREHEIYIDFLDFLLSNKKYEELANEVDLLDLEKEKRQRVLQIAGAYFSYAKDYSKALDLYLRAEKILDKKDLKDSYLYSDIAYTYEIVGAEKKALVYYRKSLKLRNDLLLQEVAFQLETKIHDTIELSYNFRNEVKEKKIEYKNRNGDFEMKLNLSKIEQHTRYFLEIFHDKRIPLGAVIGNMDRYIYGGNKLKGKLGTRYFLDTLVGAQEKAQNSFSQLSYDFQLGEIGYQATYSRSHYKNPFGNIGSTSGYSLTASKSISKNYTLSGGYSQENVRDFTPVQSNVFLDDFRSLSTQYRFDRRGHVKFKYYALVGVAYRFGGLNPSLGFGFRWDRNWYFDYEIFQDKFSNQNIKSYQLKYLKLI